MKPRLMALLDRPDPRSLGIVPAVVAFDGHVSVLGLSQSSRRRAHPLTEDDVKELVEGKHALRVEGDFPDPVNLERQSALWIGDLYRKKAESAGIPIPPLPRTIATTEGGSFVIQETSKSREYVQIWIERAFARFSRVGASERRVIGDLLKWSDPRDKRVAAAALASAKNQRRELDWQMRTLARGLDADAWSSNLNELLSNSSDPFEGLKVYVFIGGSGTLREALANKFSEATGWTFRSFTHPIANQAGSSDKKKLMEVGQRLVERQPLQLVLDVVRPFRMDPSPLVVDSVRHQDILDALRWFCSADGLHSVGIVEDPKLQRERISARGLSPDEILEDPTEREISSLVMGAQHRVSSDKEVAELVAKIT